MLSLALSMLTIAGIFAGSDYQQEQYEVDYYANEDENNQGDYDPKENFFRGARAHESQADRDFLEVPRPGGLNIYADESNKSAKEKRLLTDSRSKRNAERETSAKSEVVTEKPLDIAILNFENSTSIPNNSIPEVILAPQQFHSEEEDSKVGINDFIRFRRDLKLIAKDTETFGGLKVDERRGRMLMAPEDMVSSGNREPRGAIKEQWIKQPYPVQTKTESYEDNSSSASEIVRAPRVHFVTQRRSESAPPEVYRQFEREGQPRNYKRDDSRLSPRDGNREFYSRQSRNYDPYPAAPAYYEQRYDPYYRSEDFRRHEQKYEPADRDEGYGKQRRIIYYATLPEIVRSPPNVDLRDRYSYRDRYDDRYVTSRPLAVSADPYGFRKGYPVSKARYEEHDRTKAPYPLKVSTDVNVREIKKNPERRIYSEADQRYAYKAPSYQSEGSYDRRQ